MAPREGVSEAEAAQMALVNLSVHAGFSDVTRLILKVESSLTQEFDSYREWHAVEDVEICLQVDQSGKSAILCQKDGTMLKSVPTRLKNKAYVLEVKTAVKKLKEQYSRTKRMMEEAMESGETFTAAEVRGLLENHVVGAILRPLVFISEENMGFVEWEKAADVEAEHVEQEKVADLDVEHVEQEKDAEYVEQEKTARLVLCSWEGEKKVLEEADELRIAHPLDLYRAGVWHSCQKYLFDNQIQQPFKQIFRELYVKLPEELGLNTSRMFAGNQIQPGKTVGCLRGRRWVADYEEGLQKIYYKENIVARIYALADWFSPAMWRRPRWNGWNFPTEKLLSR